MTRPGGWPGLGFDPAPGDPAGAGGLVAQLTTSAKHLRDTHDVLAALAAQRGSWTGEASTAFAEKLAGLPRYLADAQESLQRAGGVLGEWQGELGGMQARAGDLETQAAAARTRLGTAEATEQQARGHPDFGLVGQEFSAADLPEAQRRVDAAAAELDRAMATAAGLRASLDDLLRRGEALRGEHGAAARRAAEGVRRADDGLAPPESTWFEEAAGWVGDHLHDIGDVAGMISAVAATLALIPVLTPIAAPVALAAGGVALLAHGADIAVNGRAGDVDAWVSVGGDAVGLIPGAKLLTGAAATARGSLQTADGLRHVLPAAADGVRLAYPGVVSRVGRAGPVTQRAVDAVTPTLQRWLPEADLDPARVAKVVEGAINLGSQVPKIIDWSTQEGTPAAASVVAADGATGGADLWLDHLARRTGAAAAS